MEEGEARRELHVQQEAFELGGNASSAVIEGEANGVGEKVGVGDAAAKGKKAKKDATLKAVSYWQLFQCADAADILLMVMGTIGAVVNGLTLPAMLIIQGRLINTFGNLQSSPDLIYDHIKKVDAPRFYLSQTESQLFLLAIPLCDQPSVLFVLREISFDLY